MSLNISPAPVSSAGLTFGTIARVQSASANSGTAAGTATSLVLTFGAALTVGNIVVVGVCINSATALRIYGSSGQSNRALITHAGSSGGTNVFSGIAYWTVQAAETSLDIVITSLAASNWSAVGIEYSGAKLRPDGVPVVNNASSVTSSTGNLPSSGANDVLVAVFGTRGTFAAEQTAWLTAPTNSFASVIQTSTFINTANSDRAVAITERFVSAAGTYSTGGTQANNSWTAHLGSFVSD